MLLLCILDGGDAKLDGAAHLHCAGHCGCAALWAGPGAGALPTAVQKPLCHCAELSPAVTSAGRRVRQVTWT